MDSMDKASRLIDKLYREGLDDNIWCQVTGDVADYMNAANGVICFRDIDNPANPYFYSFAEEEPDLADIFTHSSQSPLLTAMREREYGVAVLSSLVQKERHAEFDAFVKSAWTPFGIANVLCGTAYRDNKVEAVVAVWRKEGEIDFHGEEITHFETLLKHIGRIYSLQQSVSAYTTSNEILTSVMNISAHGLAVCNGRGEVLVQNSKMASLLNDRQVIRNNVGRLRFNERSYQAEFHALLQNATGFGIGKDIGGMWIQSFECPDMFVTVMPFHSAQDDKGFGANCLVSIYDGKSSDNRDVFRSIFKLTLAEADLASRLSRGAVLSDIAAEKGVSKHTVRSQLKSLFQKTGTTSQNQLIALLNHILPAIKVK